MPKPTRLRYQGTVTEVRDDAGSVIETQVDRYFSGVPARDLDETDIADLDADTLKNIMGGPEPLYVDPDADKPAKKAARKKVASKKPTAKTRSASKVKAEPTPQPIAEPEPAVELAPDAPMDSTDGTPGSPDAE